MSQSQEAPETPSDPGSQGSGLQRAAPATDTLLSLLWPQSGSRGHLRCSGRPLGAALSGPPGTPAQVPCSLHRSRGLPAGGRGHSSADSLRQRLSARPPVSPPPHVPPCPLSLGCRVSSSPMTTDFRGLIYQLPVFSGNVSLCICSSFYYVTMSLFLCCKMQAGHRSLASVCFVNVYLWSASGLFSYSSKYFEWKMFSTLLNSS